MSWLLEDDGEDAPRVIDQLPPELRYYRPAPGEKDPTGTGGGWDMDRWSEWARRRAQWVRDHGLSNLQLLREDVAGFNVGRQPHVRLVGPSGSRTLAGYDDLDEDDDR